MKYYVLIICIIVSLIVVANQLSPNHSTETESANNDQNNANHYISVLQDGCYKDWLTQEWTMLRGQSLAKDNSTIVEGIKRVCQARAELFLEGYELSPNIPLHTEEQVYPLVFQFSVEEIKSQLKINLPQLKLI